MSLTYYPLPTP
jgi:hypothetical protein